MKTHFIDHRQLVSIKNVKGFILDYELDIVSFLMFQRYISTFWVHGLSLPSFSGNRGVRKAAPAPRLPV